MGRKLFILIVFGACLGWLHAQEFKLFNRTVQIHGAVSQGIVYTDDNNWLTMKTSVGSYTYTDFGINVSMPLTDKLRIGAQVYDRNLGNLGDCIRPWTGLWPITASPVGLGFEAGR